MHHPVSAPSPLLSPPPAILHRPHPAHHLRPHHRGTRRAFILSAHRPRYTHRYIPRAQRQPAVPNPVVVAATSVDAPRRRRTFDWGSLHDYDWSLKWYPVGWARDFEPGKPTQFTLFDVDYVILRRSVDDMAPMCMLDACPHRMAALSEGRMTSTGLLQCAYHGWTFDGLGTCVDIPQTTQPPSGRRSCAVAFPCVCSQEMVWMLPSTDTEKRYEAETAGPPQVPEANDASFKVVPTMRDFPVDYSLLIENVIDFDHGPFAHQSANFDNYSGSTAHPQRVTVNNGKTILDDSQHFSINLEVRAVSEMLERVGTSKSRTEKSVEVLTSNTASTDIVRRATSEFCAPCRVITCRRNVDGYSPFLTVFWIVPTGVGRSRFLAAVVTKAAFFFPRWLVMIGLNNFVDQDTFLLATQQTNVLAAEFAARNDSTECPNDLYKRTQMFCYQSPGDRFVVEVGKFLDRTVPSMPNRYSNLARWNAVLGPCPSRDVVLDRWEQHTIHCPESLRFVKNCIMFRNVALLVFAGLSIKIAAKAPALIQNAVAMLSDSIFTKCFWSTALAAVASFPNTVLLACVLCAAAAYAAQRLIDEFHFKYTVSMKDRDLKNIQKVYPDYQVAVE